MRAESGGGYSGFNGATAFRRWKYLHGMGGRLLGFSLQWGHRLSAVEITTGSGVRGRPRGFNGATAFRRWKFIDELRERVEELGFNGATAFRRWKSPPVIARQQDKVPASMGPPPFGGGNRQRPAAGRCARYWLQWGHRLSAVEIRRRIASPSRRDTLQWGHRLSAVEIREARPDTHDYLAASMGPPPFGGGNVHLEGRDKRA